VLVPARLSPSSELLIYETEAHAFSGTSVDTLPRTSAASGRKLDDELYDSTGLEHSSREEHYCEPEITCGPDLHGQDDFPLAS
jgi:hypothetical protein